MTATTQPSKPAGVLAEFDGADALRAAAAAVRKAGYRKFDVFTPYPVHGMDEAMGLGRSHLGWIVLICGIGGALAALLLQWYTNGYDYPLVLSGKPYFAWQYSTVVIFEVMVGASAFGAILGMLVLNGLPRWHHPLFASRDFSRATNDAFFLFVEADDTEFEKEKTRSLLVRIGGRSIDVIQEQTVA